MCFCVCVVPMQSFSSESIGAEWSTIVNLIAVTTVLRATGEPVRRQREITALFLLFHNLINLSQQSHRTSTETTTAPQHSWHIAPALSCFFSLGNSCAGLTKVSFPRHSATRFLVPSSWHSQFWNSNVQIDSTWGKRLEAGQALREREGGDTAAEFYLEVVGLQQRRIHLLWMKFCSNVTRCCFVKQCWKGRRETKHTNQQTHTWWLLWGSAGAGTLSVAERWSPSAGRAGSHSGCRRPCCLKRRTQPSSPEIIDALN